MNRPGSIILIFLQLTIVFVFVGCSAPHWVEVEIGAIKPTQTEQQLPAKGQNSIVQPTRMAPLPPYPAAPAVTLTTPASPVPQGPLPNILFILTDDLDSTSVAAMPHLKQLITDQGTSFSNYLVNISLCCPSRASTLLGEYAHNTGILSNRPPAGGFETFYQLGRENNDIAVQLHQSGYRTVLLGKYLNGYPNSVSQTYIPPGWDEWFAPVSGNPYEEYNYSLNENGKIIAYQHKKDDYLTDVLSAKAIDYLQRTAGSKQPFFMYLATYAPHGPSTPAPRHTSLFQNEPLPDPPNFNETSVNDKPAYIQALPTFQPNEIEAIHHLYIKRLRSLQAVDEMVQKLVETLQANGQLDNTYIIFTSDNGFHMGQHRLMPGKQSPYEDDIRVPLVIRGPNVKAGISRPELAGNIDLAPTFAAIAGMAASQSFDGRSLLPLLTGAPAPPDWRHAYLIQHRADGEIPEAAYKNSGVLLSPSQFTGLLEPPDMDVLPRGQSNLVIPSFIGIRTDRYLFVEYTTGERELYDLQKDPYELKNLVKKAPQDLVNQLAGWLAQLENCKGGRCRIADQKPG
ncbi:MAG: sulfatase [Omnitrophica WOR_2 bacterium]